MSSGLVVLIEKLNFVCRKSLENAAALCVVKTNFNIEIEHFLLKMFESADSDIHDVLRHYELDIFNVKKQLSASIDRFRQGNTERPIFSPHLIALIEQAWMISSLKLGYTQIRSGAVLLALIDNDALRGGVLENCPLLLRIPRHDFNENIKTILENCPETISCQQTPSAIDPIDPAQSAKEAQYQAIFDQFTVDLTLMAHKQQLDPVYGRDHEIRQVIDVLSRRRQNNPILVGDAGVGKTAIVEGLAQKIAAGDVPISLKDVSLKLLDIGLLQAGASVRGEFEQRLKQILEAVKYAKKPVILFVDEAHMLIGAGAASGSVSDAANLLKPALARGEIRTIAATTWPEYKRYIENDPALSRRFEVVKIDEPTPENAVLMLRSVAQAFAAHHNVRVLDEAISAAVSLSDRFLTGRKLPDKAVSILDTACAQVAIAHLTRPAALEEVENRHKILQIEYAMLCRESQGKRENRDKEGIHHRLRAVQHDLNALTLQIEQSQNQWLNVRDLITKINQLQHQLDELSTNKTKDIKDMDRVLLQEQIQALELALAPLNKDLAVPHCVDQHTIATVISGWTGIPIATMLGYQSGMTTQNFYEKLQNRVVGQCHALEIIAKQVISYRARLADPHKPIGVFLLVGPSGVGKTETAHALAETLTGHQRHLVSLNMTEFQESHTVSTLKGAPPGYVGYGKGGVLTEAVRRNPYSVILLDEVEKAHPDVMELFYQVFDKGVLEDADGIEINFKNALIVMTSNIAADEIIDIWRRHDKKISPDFIQDCQQTAHQVLQHHFRPSFIARTTIISYHPLNNSDLVGIARLKISTLAERLHLHHKIKLVVQDDDLKGIVDQCRHLAHGARSIDHIIMNKILPDVSAQLVEKSLSGSAEPEILLSDFAHGEIS